MKKSGDDGDGGSGVLYTYFSVLCCVLVLSVTAVVSIRFSVSGSPFRSSVSDMNYADVSIVELQKKVIAATVANPNPSRAIASDAFYYRNFSFSPIPRKSTVVVSEFQCSLNFIDNYEFLFVFCAFVFTDRASFNALLENVIFQV